jgi:hypothetical protein
MEDKALKKEASVFSEDEDQEEAEDEEDYEDEESGEYEESGEEEILEIPLKKAIVDDSLHTEEEDSKISEEDIKANWPKIDLEGILSLQNALETNNAKKDLIKK